MSLTPFFQGIDRTLESLAESDTMRAVRDGMLALVPYLLISASFVFAASLLNSFNLAHELSSRLTTIHHTLTNAMALLVSASIGTMLAIRRHLPRAPVALLCLGYAMIADAILGVHSEAARAFLVPIAIVIPMLAVPLLHMMLHNRWMPLNRDGLAGNSVKRALDLVIPGIAVAIVVAITVWLLTLLPMVPNLLANGRLDPHDAPYRSGMIFALLNSTLWFFGVHGYYALLPLIEQLDTALFLTHIAVIDGTGDPQPMNSSFLGAFVFIGGSGATLGLALALAIVSKNKQLRMLGLASLPIGVINVNEILLFGLPIILNPRLLLPFLLTPMINVTIGLAATQAGWVAVASTAVPFNSPILLNAYMSTSNDPAAVLLQAICLAVDFFIYLPFVYLMDRKTRQTRRIHFASLDTTYTQLMEAAEANATDPVMQASTAHNRRVANEKRLETLADRDFFLMYQPQISRETGRVVGCEALLRCRDERGRVYGPAEFLPWLEQAHLMSQIDLWCTVTACKQHRTWRNRGLDLPVTVNITADSLLDDKVWRSIVGQLSRADINVSVEITEQSVAQNPTAILGPLEAMRSTGACVYVDDFGTGYSALSYLHTLPVDAIKIDRSFVLALDNERGRKVMHGIIDFARALDLRVVVEGVETETQLALLPKEHPLIIQGWLYSKAIDPATMAGFVAARENQPSVTQST